MTDLDLRTTVSFNGTVAWAGYLGAAPSTERVLEAFEYSKCIGVPSAGWAMVREAIRTGHYATHEVPFDPRARFDKPY